MRNGRVQAPSRHYRRKTSDCSMLSAGLMIVIETAQEQQRWPTEGKKQPQNSSRTVTVCAALRTKRSANHQEYAVPRGDLNPVQ